MFQVEEVDMLDQIFEYHRDIGSGSFGTVHEVSKTETNVKASFGQITLKKKLKRFVKGLLRKHNLHRGTGVEAHGRYALKIISPKAGERHNWVDNECQAHSMVNGHPHIVQLHGIFHEKEQAGYAMQLEYARGGDLLEYIHEYSPSQLHKGQEAVFLFDNDREELAKRMAWQIGSALAYAHGQKIIHRDVKLENIFFKDESMEHALLGDWGLAAILEEGSESRDDACGSIHYAAPELFMHASYSYGVDMWALGVCIYATLTGNFPFFGRDNEEVLQMIVESNLPHLELALNCSMECIQVLRNLIEKDPAQRWTAEQLLQSEWFLKKD